MWTSSIVKVQIAADPRAGLGHRLVGVEINLLVFDRPPKPLDEDIVPPRAFAVHRDGDVGLLQNGREVDGRELAIPVCVEDVGLAISGECFLYSFDAKVRFHRD